MMSCEEEVAMFSWSFIVSARGCGEPSSSAMELDASGGRLISAAPERIWLARSWLALCCAAMVAVAFARRAAQMWPCLI